MLIGLKGERGEKGDTGAKIVSTELIGQDENGGNVYKQTFDDGSTATFTAPKGADGISSNELEQISNFEHPKVYNGLGDPTTNDGYPNIIGNMGETNWQLVLPEYMGWAWRDFAVRSSGITVDVPNVQTSLLYIFVDCENFEPNGTTYTITKENLLFQPLYNLRTVNYSRYRFIGLIRTWNYSAVAIPHLDMGGLPFRWNGTIVENMEVEAKIGQIETALDTIIAIQNSLIGGSE